ncbi:MAG: hypothetical protein GX075_11800 [Firmicutes bacterium]|nr:hypothetical protein [Bacillota bacterium]
MKSKPGLFFGVGFFLILVSVGAYLYQENAEFLAGLFRQPPPEAEVLVIDDGDCAHPKFSPDGRFLAYSKAVFEKNGSGNAVALTEIIVKNLEDGGVRKLLDKEAFRDYASFAAFVSGIEWLNERQVAVTISDGDDAAKVLTFDIETSELIKTEFLEGEETFLTPREQALYFRIIRLFPEFDQDFLPNSIRHSSFEIPDRGVVLQKNAPGSDRDIWFLDCQSQRITKLLEVKRGELRGGFSFGEAIVFLIAADHRGTIYSYRDFETFTLHKIRTKLPYGFLHVKQAAPHRVVFQIQANARDEEGDNPLFAYDGWKVAKLKKFPKVQDVDISAGGGRIAFCYWEKGQRKLAVGDWE